MSTNVGHEDATGGLSWATNNQSLQIDWAWRAMASSVPYAKAIVAAYYQNVPAVGNHYSGCSTGGRQGIRQVEVDANSFDGMLIGAPAWNVRSAMAVLSRIGWLGQTSGLKISPTDALLLQRIYDRVYERCKVIGFDNTANDGAIRDSVACLDLFRQIGVSGPVWSGLGCENDSPAANCVTLSQRQAFITLLEEFKAPKAPGEDPSYVGDGFDISGIKGLTTFLIQQSLTDLDQQFSRYFLSEAIVWDSDENGIDLITRSNEWDARVRANADPAVLRGWRGKTILYTGTADGTVSPLGTRRAFDLAGGTNNTKLAYFELPGMPHCADEGNGGENPPWYIGGVGIRLANSDTRFMPNTTTPPLNNAEHDALIALTEWVEGGPEKMAPTKLTATAFSSLANYTVSKRRPICAAPKRQNYTAGDINKPESWFCVAT
jgi:feruloyl esterase